jgi:hypothetical protein
MALAAVAGVILNLILPEENRSMSARSNIINKQYLYLTDSTLNQRQLDENYRIISYL